MPWTTCKYVELQRCWTKNRGFLPLPNHPFWGVFPLFLETPMFQKTKEPQQKTGKNNNKTQELGPQTARFFRLQPNPRVPSGQSSGDEGFICWPHGTSEICAKEVSKNRGIPKWMVKRMENPIKMDDLGVPHIQILAHRSGDRQKFPNIQPLWVGGIWRM